MYKVIDVKTVLCIATSVLSSNSNIYHIPGLCFRDDLLSGWVMLVSQSPVTQSLYETHSFLRDPELL